MNKVKLASGANEENFAFLTTKYDQLAKLEHLICPKVWGAQTHLCSPLLKVDGGGGHKPPPTPLI